jgi:hypothetical protein
MTPECAQHCELRFEALYNADVEQKQILERVVSRLESLRSWLVATALLLLAQTIIQFVKQ